MFNEIDTGLIWTEGDAPKPDDGFLELRVVLMPSEPGAPDWRLPSHVLGAVIFEKARAAPVCPAVYIFFPNVLRTAGSDPERSLMTPRAHRDISRVLSRVIVHEAIHAVTRLRSHARDGLMRSSLSASYLMRRRAPELNARTTADFHASLEALRAHPRLAHGATEEVATAAQIP